MAGTAVDLLFFPIDTIKTRLQAAQGFSRAGGFRGVYKGVGSVVVGSAPGGICKPLYLHWQLETMKPCVWHYSGSIFLDIRNHEKDVAVLRTPRARQPYALCIRG